MLPALDWREEAGTSHCLNTNIRNQSVNARHRASDAGQEAFVLTNGAGCLETTSTNGRVLCQPHLCQGRREPTAW